MDDTAMGWAHGDRRVSVPVRDLVSAYETAFPGRVRGYYLEGSHADHTSLAVGSDTDITVVFKERFLDADERARAEDIRSRCAVAGEIDGIEFDVSLVGEDEWRRGGIPPSLMIAGRLIYGEDTRDRFALPPLHLWIRDRMHSSYWRLIHLFARPTPASLPLAYPNSSDEFYGYVRRTLRLSDGRDVPCTRDLLRTVGWAATALIAAKAGVYVARKQDVPILYRSTIGDDFADLLDELFAICRGRWSYRIPEDTAERNELRVLCTRVLSFENAFLVRYRDYALLELRGLDAEGRAAVVRTLERAPLLDEEVQRAIRTFQSSEAIW